MGRGRSLGPEILGAILSRILLLLMTTMRNIHVPFVTSSIYLVVLRQFKEKSPIYKFLSLFICCMP